MTSTTSMQTRSPTINSFLIGAVSGSISTILLQPLDLIKTKLQQSPQTNLFSTIRCIYRSNGFPGFWVGVTPSLWRTVPGLGLYFATYNVLSSPKILGGGGGLETLSLGILSRVVAGTILLPITVVKTRWEAGGTSWGQYQGRSVLSSLVSIHNIEGTRGLLAGLVPTIIRDAPYSGIYLLLYTRLKVLVGSGSDISNFSCGLVAGVASCTAVQPADVLKTRLQLHDYTSYRQGLRVAMMEIYKEGGLRGFMVGLAPRAVRKSIMSALAWTFYDGSRNR